MSLIKKPYNYNISIISRDLPITPSRDTLLYRYINERSPISRVYEKKNIIIYIYVRNNFFFALILRKTNNKKQFAKIGKQLSAGSSRDTLYYIYIIYIYSLYYYIPIIQYYITLSTCTI